MSLNPRGVPGKFYNWRALTSYGKHACESRLVQSAAALLTFYDIKSYILVAGWNEKYSMYDPAHSHSCWKPNTMRYTLALVALAQAGTIVNATAVELDKRLDNGLGLTPPMGWSSWVSLRT